MVFFLNSPLLLLLIRSTLRSARHAWALFCQKLNLHGKQLLGQGAASPLEAGMPSPNLGAALLGREGGKTLGADSQLLRDRRLGPRLLWVGFVPGKMRIWTSQSSGL